MEDYEVLGYDSPYDILFEFFGVENEDDLEDALDSWNNN